MGIFEQIDAERKRQAAEDCGCTEDELVPCEKCPMIDDICEECGDTGWVFEGTPRFFAPGPISPSSSEADDR